MPVISKRRKANLAAATKTVHTAADAVAALRKFKTPKFDQTVNVVMHLGIDPKQADQLIRGSIGLPHGTGKTSRVVCFCQSDKVAAAKAAGAVEAGADDLVAKIEGGWMEFDVAVASPDMMRVVSKLGKGRHRGARCPRRRPRVRQRQAGVPQR
jgi:large subunit ribosomal protein L1